VDMFAHVANRGKYSPGAYLERKFLYLVFKTAHSGVLHIFERWRGPPNVAWLGVIYSPLPPSRWAYQ